MIKRPSVKAPAFLEIEESEYIGRKDFYYSEFAIAYFYECEVLGWTEGGSIHENDDPEPPFDEQDQEAFGNWVYWKACQIAKTLGSDTLQLGNERVFFWPTKRAVRSAIAKIRAGLKQAYLEKASPPGAPSPDPRPRAGTRRR